MTSSSESIVSELQSSMARLCEIFAPYWGLFHFVLILTSVFDRLLISAKCAGKSDSLDYAYFGCDSSSLSIRQFFRKDSAASTDNFRSFAKYELLCSDHPISYEISDRFCTDQVAVPVFAW